MKMNKKSLSLFSAIAASLGAAASVNAQTDLLISYDTAYQGDINVSGYINNEDVYLTAFSAAYNGGDALPFPTTSPFTTFCIDILPNLNASGSWTAQTFPSTPPPQNGQSSPAWVGGGIQTAANIYNNFVNNATVSSGGGGSIDGQSYTGEQWGAALQLAIWQDLYGSSFSATGVDSTVAALENDILNSSYNIANYNLTSTFWDATDPTVNQDLIGPQMQTGFAPESGAYGALAGFGLLVVSLRSQIRRKLA